jgi:hypothetical protein
MLPRRSICVCIFTAALVVRKCAHGKTLSERSLVVVSSAYTVFDDQGVGKIAIDLPIAFLVGVGQIAARHMTANAEMVKFGLVRAQTNLDVTETLAEGQLREGHA